MESVQLVYPESARTESQPSLHHQFLLILLPVIAAAVLLYFRLDNPILWQDEVFTSNYIRHDYNFLMAFDRPGERHPPGHYVLLKFWANYFGHDRVGVRSFSIAFALACLPLLFVITRERFGVRTALVAMLLLAIFPGFVHYGREARMYAQLFGLLLLSSLFFLVLYFRFFSLTFWSRGLLALGFALSLAATFYTHYIAVIYYACFFVAAIALAIRNGGGRWLAYALFGFLVSGLIVLPQFFHMLGFARAASDEWIPTTDLRVFYSMISGAYTAPAVAKILLYPLYMFGLFVLWRKDRDFFIFVVSFMVVGPLLMAVVGTFRPVLLVRTLQPLTLLSPIVLALAITRLPRFWALLAAAFVVVTSMITNLRDFPSSRGYLFAEGAAPVLKAQDADRVYYIEHLNSQFELKAIGGPEFVPIGFKEFDRASEAVQARLDECQTTDRCKTILLVLELDPLFEKEAGFRWLRFAETSGFEEIAKIEGYTIQKFEGNGTDD